MTVFLHTRKPGGYDWTNETREFARIPVVGEYLAVDFDSPWYQVQLVVHTPFPCEFEAEVYAVEVDQNAEQKKAFDDVKTGWAQTPENLEKTFGMLKDRQG